MTWNAPKTFTSGAILTAAELNAQIRDNLNECAPAKAATKGANSSTSSGGYFVSTGPNTLAQRVAHKDTVLTTEQTTNVSYTDLTTVGPQVTVETGAEALVIWGAQVRVSSSGFSAFVSVDVSGATTIAPDSDNAFRVMSDADDDVCGSQFCYFTTLNPGQNTFTLKYAVGGGTGTFLRRRLAVLPY